MRGSSAVLAAMSACASWGQGGFVIRWCCRDGGGRDRHPLGPLDLSPLAGEQTNQTPPAALPPPPAPRTPASCPSTPFSRKAMPQTQLCSGLLLHELTRVPMRSHDATRNPAGPPHPLPPAPYTPPPAILQPPPAPCAPTPRARCAPGAAGSAALSCPQTACARGSGCSF